MRGSDVLLSIKKKTSNTRFINKMSFSLNMDEFNEITPQSAEVVFIGRQELLEALSESLRYIPLAAKDGQGSVNFFSHDFCGEEVCSANWVFISNVTSNLQSCQMAKLLMATVGVEPAVVLKSANNCMFANLKHRSDLKKALRLSRTLLLDHNGAWYAADSDKLTILSSHAKDFHRLGEPSNTLPRDCVTVDLCPTFIRQLFSGSATSPRSNLPLKARRALLLKTARLTQPVVTCASVCCGMSCCSVPTMRLSPGATLLISVVPALKAALL
jgi:hypothetical protein